MLALTLTVGQELNSAATSSTHHPEWSRDVAIYEVNLRQYSSGGTFREFEEHLPRLKEMGIGILWFMPIHPIGKVNRKGTLGSYYSVQDYKAVNPRYGTLDEFKALVRKIHDMDMYVIIDWVANHTAWDNKMTEDHPEWFTQNKDGNFQPPVPDWHDVIDLNYDNRELWQYMADAMKFWLIEAGIDGFRCDVAEMVPPKFWEESIPQLRDVKPIFMLAEGAAPELHEIGFDMTYNWDLYYLMNDIAQGKRSAADLSPLLNGESVRYGTDDYRMLFTTNHDENSWNGTVFERLGESAGTFAVLTMTLPGMPLVYNGQESGMNKRLSFFEKDEIEWQDHPFAEIYKTLLNLKKENPALWNGTAGGSFSPIPTTNEKNVFAFYRQKGEAEVVVILNLSSKEQWISLSDGEVNGEYRNIFDGSNVILKADDGIFLEPWAYRVYSR